jgi:acyl carrier protein
MHEQIKTVLANVLGVPSAQIADDASVDNMETWDSLRQIRLLMAVEEKFGVTFTDDEISNLTSLSALVDAVQRRQKVQ